ncbi:tetraacyldisaccharide 4'-kinase [Geofilum rubicundum JCM 15548]|uniref:Tetraacyldisaccharide 4'-kinase n=1 Tax=Geofilum rubicundum JCM 15548 TaxID=1236989 RepID=A0A0E9LY61_9BACT|nr:tetraacyldisaccharide 4'-kinase [Geofilum rubicundum]GAO30061.1 tetraacyldisaccharide 4'-kinase [Geofilum rubicundum JCM 15548]
MEALLNQSSPPDVVLLDDAFQHRYVKPGLSIMVMDYHRPLWKDTCLPAGNLRESASGINRADLIIINKCPPHLKRETAHELSRRLRLKNKQPVFFTSIEYDDPVALANGPSGLSFTQILQQTKSPFIAIAGIGNPIPFFESLERFHVPFKTRTFKDHHAYTSDDLELMAGCNGPSRKCEPRLLPQKRMLFGCETRLE